MQVNGSFPEAAEDSSTSSMFGSLPVISRPYTISTEDVVMPVRFLPQQTVGKLLQCPELQWSNQEVIEVALLW